MKQRLNVTKSFSDKLDWNSTEKTAVSIRDGVLEYLGLELGMRPAYKIFKVYRSPATIANVAGLMNGIPVTDRHVDPLVSVRDGIGHVNSSEMVDMIDASCDSKLAVKNKLTINDASLLDSITHRGLSLGYTAKLVGHDVYDLEQKNIVPHHLAIVEKGRCGTACSFLDKKEVNRMARNIFMDEDGDINLEEIVRIVQDFQEAVRKAPIDKVQEVMPALKELIAMAKSLDDVEKEDLESEASDVSDDVNNIDNADNADDAEDGDDVVDEQIVTKSETEDEDDKKIKLMDSSVFKDAVNNAVKYHAKVIQKATPFLDKRYKFSDKTTKQIMRDALRAELPNESFKDSELDLAFKFLKKTQSKLSSFGDSAVSAWDKLKTKDY